jgi:hypothetical protein
MKRPERLFKRDEPDDDDSFPMKLPRRPFKRGPGDDEGDERPIWSLMLEDVGPRIVEAFRTSPKVAGLIDPAVWIYCDGESYFVDVRERLEIINHYSGTKLLGGPESAIATPLPEDTPVYVQVDFESDGGGGMGFAVVDPRVHPEEWPWSTMPDAIDPDDERFYVGLLEAIGPDVARHFRENPNVADMIEPAVWVRKTDEDDWSFVVMPLADMIKISSELLPLPLQNRGFRDTITPEFPVIVNLDFPHGNAPNFGVAVADPREHRDVPPWASADDN